MRVELVTEDLSRTVVLDTLPAIIGRGADTDVNVDDSFVGKYHCLIDREGDTLRVLDLGTRTGTFVNGRRVKREAVVMPGDKLTVGRTTFVAQYDRSPIATT